MPWATGFPEPIASGTWTSVCPRCLATRGHASAQRWSLKTPCGLRLSGRSQTMGNVFGSKLQPLEGFCSVGSPTQSPWGSLMPRLEPPSPSTATRPVPECGFCAAGVGTAMPGGGGRTLWPGLVTGRPLPTSTPRCQVVAGTSPRAVVSCRSPFLTINSPVTRSRLHL